MMNESNETLSRLIDQAVAGDRESLQALLLSVQDLVFSLSLRMLGAYPDAEDATQDILLKVMTRLSSFKGESAFSTWVFRIAVNHLTDYKKHMFAAHPLTFAFYGDDIRNADLSHVPDGTQNVDRSLLAEELKLSCTNVMLQCLDPESRCVFILGTMFALDSRVAGDVLGITPEAYRQRLSRVRRTMAAFLREYCGEYGQGACRCQNRVDYAIMTRRLNPKQLDYTASGELETLQNVKSAMESIDEWSQELSFCMARRSPERLRQWVRQLLDSPALAIVKQVSAHPEGPGKEPDSAPPEG